MSQPIRIQMQSVAFNNSPSSLLSSLVAASNAVRVAKQYGNLDVSVVFVCGDASPVPIIDSVQLQLFHEQSGDIDYRYDFFGQNTGSAKGHNLLASETDSQYILIMNPDVKLSPRFFINALSPFSNRNVGMVEARQTPIEHQKQYNINTFETDWATTACVVIRREIFHILNGFDADTFFLYCDDLDFSWRMRLLGYTIFYQPTAPVYHAKSLSNEGNWIPSETEIYYSAEAALLMAHKWSNPERVAHLLSVYDSASPIEQRAAATFRKRAISGLLPQPIDPGHTIARFLGDYYSENRYIL